MTSLTSFLRFWAVAASRNSSTIEPTLIINIRSVEPAPPLDTVWFSLRIEFDRLPVIQATVQELKDWAWRNRTVAGRFPDLTREEGLPCSYVLISFRSMPAPKRQDPNAAAAL